MIYTIADFPLEVVRNAPIVKRGRGNQGTKTRNKYKDLICAFDIETTTIDEITQAIMYIWQLQIGEDITIIGRTWEEYTRLLNLLRCELEDDVYMVFFVHNLSFEFQFLRGIYPFNKDEVFAIDSRKVLKCTMHDHFEYRCSYLHSNMSLSEYTKKMGAKHQKLSGDEFDYKRTRYPWTELSPRELEYCINDVLGLVEAIGNEMKHDGDTLYTFPLTSTGYVRRDAKAAMRKVNPRYVKDQLPDIEIYSLCREAFRGGNTHANRYYSGKVLENVNSADMSSAYPYAVCNCEFPVSRFFHYGSATLDEVLTLIRVRRKALLMRVAISNVELSNPYWGSPYLSRDKCRNIRGGVFDNGRILSADYLETTITDIDLQIILQEYKFADIVFSDVAHARYGKLPQPLIDETIKYYVAKTELKGVPGQEVYYMKSKNKLNSIYGMMAQDPVKQSIDFINNEFVKRSENPEEILTNTNKRAFLCYQWGVWVTAWVRYRLEYGIKKAGAGFVYCDTDSVKYIGNIDWSEYNEQRKQDSLKSGSYATDPSGETHYMGVYEYDGHYAEFSTLGAKKYCYTYDKGGKLYTTIAGVTKRTGGAELEKYGGIKAFKPGFIFREAGGTESIYNDSPEITSYDVDGRTIPITSNIVIKDSTYTLGITAEYERLLEDSKYFPGNT